MKTSSNKIFSRKHDRKVLVAEESTKSWADSDSDSSSSSSSSSESEQEEVHCFMADQTDDDEEAKAEKMSLKNSSAESSSDELEDTDILKTELCKLQAENEMMKDETSELKAEIEALNQLVGSWNHSSQVLHKLSMYQKQASDKTGIGFNNSEFSEGETSIISDHLLFAMAASFYSNSQHVDFESVLSMDDQDMVSMFKAIMASGLAGFLGCPAVIYEDALVDFFENASVREGVIISTVAGQLVEISEEWFVESFELPVDGLGDLSKIPKDAIFDARSIVSLSGEPISLSGRKNQMKFEFRLLCDIMAKAISVKAGSFNAITVEKFSLITAVVCSVRMNWAKFLFSILKKMVTPGSKQAKGFAIQIGLLLANIPNLELGASLKFPASKILTKKTVHRFVSINDRDGAEEATGAAKQRAASKKRPAADVRAAVTKKKRTIKKKSVSSLSSLEMVAVAQEAVPIQQVAEPSAVEETRCPSADDVDFIIQQVLEETREVDAPTNKVQPAVTEEKHWFDLPYEDLIEKWAAERPVVTASDTDEEEVPMEVGTAGEDQQKSLEDILLKIPVDVPLPSTGMEVTKIVMGQTIKIPGVTKWTWFLNSLPRIPADDKGKEILVEKDPVKGNPAKEHYSLICADIDLLVALREKVIDEVALFFNSFSLKKLATINIDEMYKKEEQVLSWGETESPQVAIQRKSYILLKYRRVLIWKFLESWRSNFVPGQGSTAVDRRVIELLSDRHGSPRDRGAVISRTNTYTRSSCWIRMMILVDGVWTVEPCADKWVKIPRQVISTEVPRQRQYDDTLPKVSEFFRLMKKRWADVCLEVTEFCAYRRLLPVGSINFCRALEIVETDSCVVFRQPTVFTLRLSQFCTVHIQYSLFRSLSTVVISDFLSSIALDRTALRSVQIAQSVVPSVQFSLDQRPSSPISSDSSSSLLFDVSDVDATASSLFPISQDFSAALADLQTIISEQINESQSGISSKLHKIEQVLRDSLSDQAAIFKNLSQEARQEGRSIDDVQTIRFNEFRKNILAQNASIFVGFADVRKEVQEVNAKVDIMTSRLNAIQKDVEATKEALSHQLFEFQSQAQENHSVLHAQLSELVDYIHRGGADKKGESGSRGLQQPANVQIEGSAERPTFAQRVEMAQRHIVHTVLDADVNRALLERQAAAERDRERIRREARMLKRRIRD
ncbi:dystroglycan-like [Dorcoceras hygrometricum]|uniref:Dystroglycan-like n=1 Tax=Dorcoceras hygrometricum TaxID=472368 RepID=A0A2Z7DC77_9LAMI|nr:dystroglycan-like [Dorcoceras hygrometricum]